MEKFSSFTLNIFSNYDFLDKKQFRSHFIGTRVKVNNQVHPVVMEKCVVGAFAIVL